MYSLEPWRQESQRAGHIIHRRFRIQRNRHDPRLVPNRLPAHSLVTSPNCTACSGCHAVASSTKRVPVLTATYRHTEVQARYGKLRSLLWWHRRPLPVDIQIKFQPVSETTRQRYHALRQVGSYSYRRLGVPARLICKDTGSPRIDPFSKN